MNEINPQYLISFSALLISVSSFAFAIKSWHQSNRPIVVAYIHEELVGTNGGAFSLVLSNTGNRPATNIEITAKADDIYEIFEVEIGNNQKEIVKNIFSSQSKVALIKNGTEIKTAFGHFEKKGDMFTGIKYDSWLPITINYNDLNSKSYTSKLSLRIRGLDGFGGGIWK